MLRIFDLLFPPRADELIVRTVTIDDFLTLMNPGIVDYTRPGTVALLPFHNPVVRAAIHEAKYHGNRHAFTLLASALESYLEDNDETSAKLVIVPIPLGRERQKKRGFNQVHEVAAHTNLDTHIDATLLIRTRDTMSQVSLPRHTREENMKNAFTATRALDPSYLYIVVDDVVTTGATLQAAVNALKTAGAKDITPLALAH